MLRLFIKDNTTGHVHEYGTDKHDSLILQEDGSLHYEHMQGCVGTIFPEEGFSFCLEDGTIPEWDLEHGVEPYIDIAGEYYTKPQTNADRIRAMSDDELAPFFGRYGFCNGIIPMSYCVRQKVCSQECVVNWLRQPAEEMPSEMNEDQDHPCATCLRWSECNGVEAERCPVCEGGMQWPVKLTLMQHALTTDGMSDR